jgi:hypothetical protein
MAVDTVSLVGKSHESTIKMMSKRCAIALILQRRGRIVEPVTV